MSNPNEKSTQTWPELAIGLYDQLTDRGAEITYAFDNVKVDVPSRAGDSGSSARWVIDGTMRVSTQDRRSS